MSDELFDSLINNTAGSGVKARPNASFHLLTAQAGGNPTQMMSVVMDRLRLANSSNSGELIALATNITLMHSLPADLLESTIEDILEVAMQHPDWNEMIKWSLALVHHHCTTDLMIAQFYDFGALDVALTAARNFAGDEKIVSAACAVVSHFNCFPLGDGLKTIVNLLDSLQNSSYAAIHITKTLADCTTYFGQPRQQLEKVAEDVVTCGVMQSLATVMGLFPEDEKLQTNACHILASIGSIKDDYMRTIKESGALDLVVKAIQAFPTKETLQSHGLRVIGSSPGSSSVLQGTVEQIINSFKTAETYKLKFEAIRSLSSIAINVRDMKNAISSKGAIPLVLQTAKSFPDSPELHEEICNFLSHMAFDSEAISTAITQAGGVQEVLKSMSHFDNENVLVAACAAISGLTFNNTLGQQIVIDNRGANVIIEMMKDEGKARLQEMGCMAIGTMCWNIEIKAAVVEAGGIAAICTALNTHADNPSVVKNACRALAQIAFNSDKYRTDMSSQGAIPLIVKAMQRHPKHDRVQMHACVALSYLSWTNETNAAQIASHDGYRIIVLAMQNHPQNPEVQENACRALANISSMTLTSAEDALKAIVDALGRHDNVAEVQEEACRAIVTLSLISSANKDQLERLGAAKLVCNSLRNFPKLHLVQQEGCNALAHLAYEHGPLNKQVTELQGVELILNAMKGHPTSGKVQLNACGGLSALAFDNPVAQLQIFEFGGVECVINAMTKFDRMRMLELGCGVLGTLAWNPEIKEKVAVDAIPTILDAMRTHHDSSLLQKSTCRAISQFAFNSEANRKLLFASGAIPLIMKALKAHMSNDKLVAHALVALTYLCWENSAVAQAIVDEGSEDVLKDVQREYASNEKVVNKAVHLQKIVTRKSGQSPQPGLSPQPGSVSPMASSPQPLRNRDSRSYQNSPQPTGTGFGLAPPSPPTRDPQSSQYYLSGNRGEAKEQTGFTVSSDDSPAPAKAQQQKAQADDWSLDDEVRKMRKEQRRGGRQQFSTGRPQDDLEMERRGPDDHHRGNQQQDSRRDNYNNGGRGNNNYNNNRRDDRDRNYGNNNNNRGGRGGGDRDYDRRDDRSNNNNQQRNNNNNNNNRGGRGRGGAHQDPFYDRPLMPRRDDRDRRDDYRDDRRDYRDDRRDYRDDRRDYRDDRRDYRDDRRDYRDDRDRRDDRRDNNRRDYRDDRDDRPQQHGNRGGGGGGKRGGRGGNRGGNRN